MSSHWTAWWRDPYGDRSISWTLLPRLKLLTGRNIHLGVAFLTMWACATVVTRKGTLTREQASGHVYELLPHVWLVINQYGIFLHLGLWRWRKTISRRWVNS